MLSLRFPVWVIAWAGWLLAAPAAADRALAEAGKRQFIRCAGCHTVSPEAPAEFGPHLAGIVGRRAGTVAGFPYQEPSLVSQAFVWDEATLDRWLENPHSLAPDICLPFMGLRRAGDRQALIEYLKHPQ